jgi:hypothetical protein
MYSHEEIELPNQRGASSQEKFMAGRNIATRLVDLQMALETGDDALIDQSIEILKATSPEELKR